MKINLPSGWSLLEKEQTDSTNEEIKKLPVGSNKTAVCAEMQTGGKGRLGRHWVSPKGNLYVSFCLEPIRLEQAGIYSFLSALALAQAIEKLCPSLTIKCKWPNDLLLDGKKISGILLETNGVDRMIAGIGVNLVEFPKEKMLYPVTSLAAEGYSISVPQMLESLLERFDFWNTQIQKQGIKTLLDAWLEKAYGVGGPVTVNLTNSRIEGVFYGLDQEGCLLLNKDGEIIKITAGDVFFGQTGNSENVR